MVGLPDNEAKKLVREIYLEWGYTDPEDWVAQEVADRQFVLFLKQGDEWIDENGDYRLVNLPPGTYTITVSLPGFKTVKQAGVLVQVGPIRFRLAMSLPAFTIVVFVLGFAMSLGKAAVYKHIPVYYPDHVGSVGGVVGLIPRNCFCLDRGERSLGTIPDGMTGLAAPIARSSPLTGLTKR